MTEVAVLGTAYTLIIVQRSQRAKGRGVKRTKGSNRNEKIGARLTYAQTLSEGQVLPKRSQHILKPTKHAHAHAKGSKNVMNYHGAYSRAAAQRRIRTTPDARSQSRGQSGMRASSLITIA